MAVENEYRQRQSRLTPIGSVGYAHTAPAWMNGRPDSQCAMVDGKPAELKQQIAFESGVPHARLVSHYQNADIVINPSLSKSFGISLL